jgi:PDZ domain
MKITTQRSFLWLGNFVLAAGLIGLVVVFDKTASPKARKVMGVNTMREFKDSLREVKAKKVDVAGPESIGSKIDVVFERDFHFSGYKKPPEKSDPGPKVPVGPPKPPKLQDLVEVIFLIAPRRDAAEGSNEFVDDTGKAVLKLKKLSGAQTIFTYAEGDVIGVGDRDDRPDKESTDFTRWGGARILRIEPDRLVCRWVKYEEGDPEIVSIVSREVAGIGPDGELRLGAGTIGGGPGAAAAPTAAAADGPLFSVEDKGIRTTATLTKAGWQQINSRGNAIMDGIAFEKGKDLNGRDALKVKSMPAQLREYGLRDGDVIVRIDSVYVTSKESIAGYVKKTYRQKTNYNLQVIRDGKMRIMRVNVPRDVKKIPNSRASNAGARTRNRIRGR